MTANLTIDYIVKHGERLFKEQMGERNVAWKITNVALSFSGLERAEKGQKGIQGFFGNEGTTSKRESPAPGNESLKRKAGEAIVDLTLDGSSDVEEVHQLEASTSALPQGKADESDDDDDDDIIIVQPSGPVYTCPRCRGHIAVDVKDGESLETATSRVGASHSAMHAKQDKSTKRGNPSSKEPTIPKKKKKRKGQQNLNSFFEKALM